MIDTAENMRKLQCIWPNTGKCVAPNCIACERYPGGTKKKPKVLYYCGLSQSREIRVHPDPEEDQVNVVELSNES